MTTIYWPGTNVVKSCGNAFDWRGTPCVCQWGNPSAKTKIRTAVELVEGQKHEPSVEPMGKGSLSRGHGLLLRRGEAGRKKQIDAERSKESLSRQVYEAHQQGASVQAIAKRLGMLQGAVRAAIKREVA